MKLTNFYKKGLLSSEISSSFLRTMFFQRRYSETPNISWWLSRKPQFAIVVRNSSKGKNNIHAIALSMVSANNYKSTEIVERAQLRFIWRLFDLYVNYCWSSFSKAVKGRQSMDIHHAALYSHVIRPFARGTHKIATKNTNISERGRVENIINGGSSCRKKNRHLQKCYC